jgi:hypothetical protein
MRGILDLLRQFGFDPLKTIKSTRSFFRYVLDLVEFKWHSKLKRVKLRPALLDFRESAGSADGHYFWQDLLCAKWIYEENPDQHFDVGSRIDGFIAHLLSFRNVIQLDIREQPSTIEGLHHVVGDAQQDLSHLSGEYSSVSSLHSIEHFGLGRYGDKIQPDGHLSGIANISRLVAESGTLYLSFPIGRESIEFNSQRILDPMLPIRLLPEFRLIEFVLIPWRGQPERNFDPQKVDLSVWGQAGLYKFKRL